jgi:hypothetical protein
LRLQYRFCKDHLSIRQIRITVVGNEIVGEDFALGHFRSSTDMGLPVRVIRAMGRCRTAGSRVPLAEVREQNWVSSDLVDGVEVLWI